MALVTRPREGRGQGKPNFTLTLLTCALCFCSPLSEKRSPPRSRVSEKGVILPFVNVYHLISFLGDVLALGQKLRFFR